MSRHFNPNFAKYGREARRGRGGRARAPRRTGWRRIGIGELRLVVLGGVALGLGMAFVPISFPASETRDPRPARSAPAAPYAEAERSRAILSAQEGAPADVATPAGLVSAQPSGVRVIDGDTFDYRGMRVRIADIDTPEVNGRCQAETQLAARATRRMRGLLAEGPFELHRPPGGRDADRYGRKLRIVTRNGHSLGDRLVAEGLARTWTGRREPWC